MDLSTVITMNHQLLSLPIYLTFVVVIFMLIKIWIKSSSTTKDSNSPLPPGPRKLPFIGSLHLMVCSLPHRRLRDLATKYGPLMHLQLGEISTVVVSSPELASQVMKTHDINFSNRPYSLASEILYYGSKDIAFSPYGDYWRQMRKIVTVELLSSKKVKQMEPIRDEEVSKFIKNISIEAGSTTRINLSKMLASLSYDITVKATFGGISEKNKATFMVLEKQLNEVLASVNLADMFPSVKLFQLMSSVRPRVEKLHYELDKALKDIIDECQTRKAEMNSSDVVAVNFLDTFLHLKEHGDFKFPLALDNIKAVVMDIFLAGLETTATTLEWIMAELVRNPRVIVKAQTEVGSGP